MTFLEKWRIEDIENEIMEYLDTGKKVYIESGCLNDAIIDYSVRTYKTYAWQEYEEKEVTFTTSACVFPLHLNLKGYSSVDSEDFNGHLFVKVS